MTKFGNLKSEEGLNELNNFLTDKSYIDGFTPSQADVSTLEALSGQPGTKYTHVLRWFNHINSYGAECKGFPGEKLELSENVTSITKPVTPPAKEVENDDDDDDIDLFGSDDEEEDAEAARIKEERLKAYAEKKSKKPGPIAKSQILLDCKPWDDETDMKKMEDLVRTIEMDGLVWGSSKLNPLAYGINKLTIVCTVEDEKVSVDDLIEKIEAFEDCVQSVDIAAFNKV